MYTLASWAVSWKCSMSVHWQADFDNLVHDFRYALRSLSRDRRFAFLAILTLALGIGAATSIFL